MHDPTLSLVFTIQFNKNLERQLFHTITDTTLTIINHPVILLSFSNNVRVFIFIHHLINIIKVSNLVRKT